MKIAVHYFAQARMAAGRSTEEYDFPQRPLIREVLRNIVERHVALRPIMLDASGDPQPSLLVFVNDNQIHVDSTDPVSENSTLTLLPPMAGG